MRRALVLFFFCSESFMKTILNTDKEGNNILPKRIDFSFKIVYNRIKYDKI